MSFDWKATLGTIAPLIGTAIGGPLGGIALKVATSALGLPEDTSEEEFAKAIEKASPTDLLALKKADQDFKKSMRELDIKEDQLYLDSQDSARKRDVALGGDLTTHTIAIVTVVGIFLMIGYLIVKGSPDNLDKTILGMLLGYAIGLAQQVYNFLFGSSKGSQNKDKLLKELKNR